MVYSAIFPPNFTPISSTTPAKDQLSSHSHLLPTSLPYRTKGRGLLLPPSVASIPYQPVNVDYLEEEFSGHGVTFEGIGEGNYVAKMELQNGSSATLMLPGCLITSYKAPMWHGGSLELLHTTVSGGEYGGDPVVQGGLASALFFGSENGEASWSPSSWILNDIRGNSQDFIQVELVSGKTENMVEARHILTLREDVLSLETVISNLRSSPLQWTGSTISHLTVSSPDATYAVGLEGSNFLSIPPFLSNFSLVPPEFKQKKDSGLGRFWGQITGKGFRNSWNSRNQKNINEKERRKQGLEEEMEGEEDDNYKQLNEEMSRIYTSAPTYFTVIDRGRRNSITVGRDGFNELYMFSPGSRHEWYGKYAYICVGQSAMLKPRILGPGEVWQGAQHLQNPNL